MSALPPPPIPHRLPEPVARMLRAAREAERETSGPGRRAAFRLTRALLGGARTAGYSAAVLADCLSMSAASVRDRSGADDWVGDVELSTVLGIPPSDLRSWHAAGVLTQHCHNAAGQDCYVASEVVLAVGRLGSASRSG